MDNRDAPTGGTPPPSTTNPNPNPNSGEPVLDKATRDIQQARAAIDQADTLISGIADSEDATDAAVKPGKYKGNTRDLINKGALMMMNDAPALFTGLGFDPLGLYGKGIRIDTLEIIQSRAVDLADKAGKLLAREKARAAGMTTQLSAGVTHTMDNPLENKDVRGHMTSVSKAYRDADQSYGEGLKATRDDNEKHKGSKDDLVAQQAAEIQRLKLENQVLQGGRISAGDLPGAAAQPKAARRKTKKAPAGPTPPPVPTPSPTTEPTPPTTGSRRTRR